MKKTLFVLLPVLVVGLSLLSSFEGRKKNCSIDLHYTLNYNEDSWEKNRVGFLWTLSYLGAELPKNSFNKSIKWVGPQTFRVDFSKLGFSTKAQTYLQQLCDSLKQTGIYRKQGSLDLGHFIALTLGSTWHYYQITGVPRTLAEFLKQHQNPPYEVFPITRSTVSEHHRIVKIHLPDSVLLSSFIAEEGHGNVTDGSFETVEYETMDIMKNGQLRFMVYNKDGHLIAAGDKELGESGKTAKCIWCHEINIQPLFRETDTVKGYMTPATFLEKIKNQRALLTNYRYRLNGDIEFRNLQDHAFQELIYISFMEPSVKRLAQEWRMSEQQVDLLLKKQRKHRHHEFQFLGDLMERDSVQAYAPATYGILPGSIREETEREPNFFRRANN